MEDMARCFTMIMDYAFSFLVDTKKAWAPLGYGIMYDNAGASQHSSAQCIVGDSQGPEVRDSWHAQAVARACTASSNVELF